MVYRPSVQPAMNTCPLNQHDITIMGYSMQTSSGYRYTEWIEFKNFSANWTNIYAKELYLDTKENMNVAYLPKYYELTELLSKQLRAGWIGALPTTV